jgi:Family of unknown function (DUF6161)
MSEPEVPPAAKPEPLFTLDLLDNGGTLQPTTFDEATTWIQLELTFWSWLKIGSYGNHDQRLGPAIGKLKQAASHAHGAKQYIGSNSQQIATEIAVVRSLLEEAFVQHKLPHSSTPLAKRIEAFRSQADDRSASFFAAALLAPDRGFQFEPHELGDWRGVVEALIDRFQLASAPQRAREQAAEQSFEQLRTKVESLLGAKTSTYDALHRQYAALAESVRGTADSQAEAFDAAQVMRDGDFEALVNQHKEAMESLRKTFREEIALRAPAEYWETKRQSHLRMSWITGALSFLAIGSAASGLVWLIHDWVSKTPAEAQPATWRIAMAVLVGVFALWGARLIVRMFLSHLHLLTDAAERVVMVKTYLSLLEGDRLASKEDRQLILSALFRPAADGIVKDEAIPPSMMEFLTRQGRS